VFLTCVVALDELSDVLRAAVLLEQHNGDGKMFVELEEFYNERFVCLQASFLQPLVQYIPTAILYESVNRRTKLRV